MKKLFALMLSVIIIFSVCAAPFGAQAAVEKVSSVSVISKTAHSVRLKWKKVGSATGYQIYYSTVKTKNFKKVKTLKKGSTVKATVSDLKSNKSYYFKVRAVNGDEKGKLSKVVWAKTVDDTSGTVTFVAVGDNLIHKELIASGKKKDGTRDYSGLYRYTKKYIQAADIASINQETILGGDVAPYTGFPVFNSPQEIGDAVADAGFDVMTLASNHCMDVGTKGIDSELNFLHKKHPEIKTVGLYKTKKESQKIVYIKKNNIKIALLNYTYDPEFSNGIPLPKNRPWTITNLNQRSKIKSDVKEAKKHADIVIAFPHWGKEYNMTKTPYEEKCTKMFSDYGVDIVIGTHPHVIGPVEWVKNKKTGKKMLVYYSLGNYVSFQDTSTPKMLEGMATFTLKKVKGKVTIQKPKLVPMVNYITRKNGKKGKFDIYAYMLKDYTNEMAKAHLQPELAQRKKFVKLYKRTVSKQFRTTT